MVKKQRGEAAPARREDMMAEAFSMAPDSSDEEAPEEVTFEESKNSALRTMKQALDRARREKEELKEKRRKRQELFQEQKKRRLLPADVLEEIDTAPSKKQKLPEDQDEEEEGAGSHEDDEEREEEEEPGGRANVQENVNPHVRNLKGNYTVTTVKEQPAASCQQRAAMDFLQSRLYGVGSGRTTSNELLSLDNKTGKNKSPAVQFVKKDWASKEKAKAEKLKKRWIQKQQIPSS